jgi:type I site-specific restriction endonuclease
MSQQSPSIDELVQGFATHIKALKSPETKEATVRQNYIDPFWRALGWDVGDTEQRGPAEAEVIIEKTVETAESTGLRNRRPDYLFRLSGFPRFIVEAKKPIIDIDDDKEAIFQAKQYAWNSTIPFAILTDFEQFRLYDTTLKPIFQDPERGLVRDFALTYDQYKTQWDVLTNTFGRAAVEGGSLGETSRRYSNRQSTSRKCVTFRRRVSRPTSLQYPLSTFQ